MRRGPDALIVGLLGLLLASCSATPPTALPSPGAPLPSNRFGAPPVTNARNVDVIATAPCTHMLSDSELRTLGFTSPGRQRSFLGITECSWDAVDGQNLRMYADRSRDLLVDTYRTQRGGVFLPLAVEGMPAVRQKTGRGDLNVCTITTGLGPTQALETTWNGEGDPRPGNDACEFAEQATALVIRKLAPQR
jgi:hypothetical protein